MCSNQHFYISSRSNDHVTFVKGCFVMTNVPTENDQQTLQFPSALQSMSLSFSSLFGVFMAHIGVVSPSLLETTLNIITVIENIM